MDQPQGNGAPGAPQGEDQPKPVSLEDVNRAITARLKSFETKQEKAIADAMGGLSTKLDEFASKLTAPPAPMPDKKGTEAVPAIEEHPLFKGMQKKVAELEAQTAAVKAERDAEPPRTEAPGRPVKDEGAGNADQQSRGGRYDRFPAACRARPQP